MERVRKMAAYLWNFRYLPMKYRWRLIKLRRLLFPTETPLHLRHSVRFARALRHPPLKSPVLFVLGLLWPFPTWKFAAELPLRPRLIIENPKPVRLRGDDLHFLRIIPLWSSRDTPERALYRIYEAVCAEDGDLIASEIQYFWCKTSWATINIADPECKDQEQYAVMAATAEAIVECFNWRIKMGLRRDDPLFMNAYKEPRPVPPEGCPSWALTVGPLPEKLSLGTGGTYYDSPFHRRNIYTSTGDFYSV
ncbi:hypothetical protein MY1884_001671 [Beauveria asiatica]|uniref:DNA-binding protein n=1 Tax=Beauveria asiatica TaxID=1069075 RepID=A0AAW0S0V6_9HYPO